MTPPKSKHEFMDRWLAGQCGNRLGAWPSVDDIPLAQRLSRRYGIRVLAINSPLTLLNTTWYHCADHVHAYHLSTGDYYMCESPDNSNLLHQGNLMYSLEGGTGLVYEYGIDPRQTVRSVGLNGFATMRGTLHVQQYLQATMSPNAYEEVMNLVYSGGVVELQCMSTYVGIQPRNNTIIWEWRDY